MSTPEVDYPCLLWVMNFSAVFSVLVEVIVNSNGSRRIFPNYIEGIRGV